MSHSRDQERDPHIQQVLFELMEELQVSALEALWFVEGDALDEET